MEQESNKKQTKSIYQKDEEEDEESYERKKSNWKKRTRRMKWRKIIKKCLKEDKELKRKVQLKQKDYIMPIKD